MSPVLQEWNYNTIDEICEKAKRGQVTPRDLAILIELHQQMIEWLDYLMDNLPPQEPFIVRINNSVNIKFRSIDHFVDCLIRIMYDNAKTKSRC